MLNIFFLINPETWKRDLTETELFTFDQFLTFLNEQCKTLESAQHTSELNVKYEKPANQVNKP
jgi:hypothetical protein